MVTWTEKYFVKALLVDNVVPETFRLVKVHYNNSTNYILYWKCKSFEKSLLIDNVPVCKGKLFCNCFIKGCYLYRKIDI